MTYSVWCLYLRQLQSVYRLLFSDVLFDRFILKERLSPGTQTAHLRHPAISSCKVRHKKEQLFQGFDVEYIYGFVRWGVCRQSRWRHSVPHSRWRICVTMATLWQKQDGCYILHLQQYSHRLNLLYIFFLSFFFFPETSGIGEMLLTALWNVRHGI